MFEGRWVSEVTAGGCGNYKGTAAIYGPHILSTKHGVLLTVNEASCYSSSGRCKKVETVKLRSRRLHKLQATSHKYPGALRSTVHYTIL